MMPVHNCFCVTGRAKGSFLLAHFRFSIYWRYFFWLWIQRFCWKGCFFRYIVYLCFGFLSVTFWDLPLPWSFIHFGFCHESQHKVFLSLEVVTVVAMLFRPHLCSTVAIKSRVICFWSRNSIFIHHCLTSPISLLHHFSCSIYRITSYMELILPLVPNNSDLVTHRTRCRSSLL
jgi:hypothetical protein